MPALTQSVAQSSSNSSSCLMFLMWDVEPLSTTVLTMACRACSAFSPVPMEVGTNAAGRVTEGVGRAV